MKFTLFNSNASTKEERSISTALGKREDKEEGSWRGREREKGNISFLSFPRVMGLTAGYRLVPSALQQGSTHLIPSSLFNLAEPDQ